MPTWGELIQQIQEATTSYEAAHDYVRHQSIANLNQHTGRAAILYAGGHLQKPDAPSATSIDPSDVSGFMEAIYGLQGKELDLILHSPGGSVEATEAIGEYLRNQFDHIRVFVPHMAMSAATVLAFVADEIVMAAHSQLGPIDPQFILQTHFGVRMIPGQAITEQFERAKQACLDNPAEHPVWAEMLQQYGPSLLVEVDKRFRAFRICRWRLAVALYVLPIHPGRKGKQVQSRSLLFGRALHPPDPFQRHFPG